MRPSNRWSTGSPCPPVTIAAAAPSSTRRSASSAFDADALPVSVCASARFGVTTVASGKSRSTSAPAASAASRRAPEVAISTGSTTSGTRCASSAVGDRVDHRARAEHPRLDGIDAEVVEHRSDLRGHDRRQAPRAPPSRRPCSEPSTRRSRTSRRRPRRRMPSGRPGCLRRPRCRSRRSSVRVERSWPPFAGMTRIRFDGCDLSLRRGTPVART